MEEKARMFGWAIDIDAFGAKTAAGAVTTVCLHLDELPTCRRVHRRGMAEEKHRLVSVDATMEERENAIALVGCVDMVFKVCKWMESQRK